VEGTVYSVLETYIFLVNLRECQYRMSVVKSPHSKVYHNQNNQISLLSTFCSANHLYVYVDFTFHHFRHVDESTILEQ